MTRHNLENVTRFVNGLPPNRAAVRVALLEDTPSEAQAFVVLAEQQGWVVTWCPNGESFLRLLERESFDALVLDWRLPGMSGYDVLRWVRAKNQYIPVLMLTANTGEGALVQALNDGADDYVVKPWRASELVARLSRLIAPAKVMTNYYSPRETLHGCTFDRPTTTVALRDGRRVALAPKEFEVALIFFHHMDQAVSRTHLLESVWREDAAKASPSYLRKVDTVVSRVRQKLDFSSQSGFLLKSEHGMGYRLHCLLSRADTDVV